eukprot:m.105432 g.105432  ORF g.105432 m.105432 type:complete len:718 (+) comp22491_c0_seq1:56-2209(+)
MNFQASEKMMVSDAKPATPQIQTRVEELQEQIETHLDETFSTFQSISFVEQGLAHIIFYVKIHIGSGRYIHVRIHSRESEATFEGVLTNKTLSDPITPFAGNLSIKDAATCPSFRQHIAGTTVTGSQSPLPDSLPSQSLTGLLDSVPVDQGVRDVVAKVRGRAEELTQRQFSRFEPVKAWTQVVAGRLWFVKVATGDDTFCHLRIYERAWEKFVDLQNIECDKTASDPIDLPEHQGLAGKGTPSNTRRETGLNDPNVPSMARADHADWSVPTFQPPTEARAASPANIRAALEHDANLQTKLTAGSRIDNGLSTEFRSSTDQLPSSYNRFGTTPLSAQPSSTSYLPSSSTLAATGYTPSYTPPAQRYPSSGLSASQGYEQNATASSVHYTKTTHQYTTNVTALSPASSTLSAKPQDPQPNYSSPAANAVVEAQIRRLRDLVSSLQEEQVRDREEISRIRREEASVRKELDESLHVIKLARESEEQSKTHVQQLINENHRLQESLNQAEQEVTRMKVELAQARARSVNLSPFHNPGQEHFDTSNLNGSQFSNHNNTNMYGSPNNFSGYTNPNNSYAGPGLNASMHSNRAMASSFMGRDAQEIHVNSQISQQLTSEVSHLREETSRVNQSKTETDLELARLATAVENQKKQAEEIKRLTQMLEEQELAERQQQQQVVQPQYYQSPGYDVRSHNTQRTVKVRTITRRPQNGAAYSTMYSQT